MTTDWSELVVDDWSETRDSLQLRLQIIGKLTLNGAARQNHWWQVALRLSPRGFRTPLLQAPEVGEFDIEIDLVAHHIQITTAADWRRVGLTREPLRDFYQSFTAALHDLEIEIDTLPRPVEVPDPATPFDQDDGHSAYDLDSANAFWRLLKCVDRVFETFGAQYLGKQSRPGLWWGALDYAASRYSGRPAPKHPGGALNVADWVMHEAYSHEVAAHGYFADAALEGSFYAYTYPTPAEYRNQPMPDNVTWSDDLGEWLLPYHIVRRSPDPDTTLYDFLQAAYDAAERSGSWPPNLQRTSPPIPGDLRPAARPPKGRVIDPSR